MAASDALQLLYDALEKRLDRYYAWSQNIEQDVDGLKDAVEGIRSDVRSIREGQEVQTEAYRAARTALWSAAVIIIAAAAAVLLFGAHPA